MNELDKAYIGKKVIVRSSESGVHFGELSHFDSSTRSVMLKDLRRLWYWRGFTLSQVAVEGQYDDQARMSIPVEEMIVTGVSEIIPCTEKSIKNLSEYPIYNPHQDK